MMSHNHKQKIYLAVAVVILFLFPSAYAFRNMMNGKRFLSMWTWMGGANAPNATGNYGNQGSSAPTPPTPGSRMNSCSWTDSAGNKWFFGGYLIAGNNLFNDLWKYDPVANEWTWVSGSNLPNSSSSYGVQGVPAATNYPGSRQGCVSWIDASDNLWLLGGYTGTSYYNDLWKYNISTNQWTWITGSSSVNQPGTYGTQGVAAAANTPGGRGNGQGWKDAAGNFYLFGGIGSSGALNDLWKFNISTNQWAWISGSNGSGVINGVYGTKGSSAPVPPHPGARTGMASCTDATTGNQWVFGGINSGSYYNDLWKYNPSSDQWTWMAGLGLSDTGVGVHGTKGVAAAANYPGPRSSSSCWTDLSGNFWLFGGLIAGSPQMNDLWKFDISTNQWTWMAGSNSINQPATYGTQGVAAAANTPSFRNSSATWTDSSGHLWLFGGFNLNDLWKFDTSVNQWIWVSGTPSTSVTYSIYGTQGSTALAPPALGARYSPATWTDASGEQWFFGGYAGGYWNDLWKYNSTSDQWTWMAGPTTAGGAGIYGTKGTPAASNTPGARNGSATWSDTSGNLWLFGGLTGSYMNDLWKYDKTTSQWTWMTGSNTGGATGVYGTQGVASATTTPGARTGAFGWTDASGNFWLYGGYNGAAYFNDLWKYDPSANQWTWMTGSSSTGSTGYYGTKGTPTASTTPSARTSVAGAKDASGTLWLFGGSSFGSNYNDLWKYNIGTNQWTWVSGTNGSNQPGVYGTQGVAAGTNYPGGRGTGSMAIDSNNIMWFFGGANSANRYNDLWKYDISTNQWAWMTGSSAINQLGTYGTKGTPGASNTPGARNYLVSWIDASDKLWLFGGNGYSNTASLGNLNDVWKYDPTVNQWTWISGGNVNDVANINGTKGSTAGVPPFPGSRYQSAFWKDASGNFWLFGGTGYSATTSSGNLNDLWKYNPTSGEWTWMSGGISPSAYGTYGTKGIAAAANVPGARTGSSGFLDTSGNFWIFGGNGFGASGSSGYLNDLWKYDSTSNQWTWTSGVSSTNVLGIYGTQGVGSSANAPGARNISARWADSSGNLWLLGGNGYPASGSLGPLNDLWKYNVASGEWTWISGSTATGANAVYGTKGSAALVAPFPGSRYSSTSWKDSNGIFWLHGGFGNGEFESAGTTYLNDLWKYDPVAAEWTWMSGSNTTSQVGVYGTQGTPAASNVPGARQSAVSWSDASNNLYLFSGQNGNRLNDLWKYDQSTNQWTWLTGSNTGNQLGVYGTQGVAAAANTPGSRHAAVAWSTSANYFWIYGGYDNAGNASDLWKYDPGTNQWTWVSGPNTVNGVGAYGTQGSTALVPPMPMARNYAASWKDASGNFWLFGGNNLMGSYNDLWKYNPTLDQWTWISGSSGPNIASVHGTKGVAAASNMPGSRYSPLTWVDGSGNFWVLGGYGYSAASVGFLNDLWKYDPATNQWTWMAGSTTQNNFGTYGTQGVASATTTPGGRNNSVGFKDASGNLFVFGGNGYASVSSGYLNDLWKYDISTNQWAWMAGTSGTNQVGNYGTQGVTTATNYPGSRYYSVGLTDSSGNFWLFGGAGYAAAGSGELYDLWKYNTTTSQWTWMKGPNTTSNYGTYGALGREGTTYQPGGRQRATGWIDANDNIWIFGGWGYAAASYQNLADLWRYNPTTNMWAWMSGSNITNTNGVYGTLQTPSTLSAPGSRQSPASWYGDDGNLWMFGGAGYGGTGTTGNLNDLWRYRLK